MTTTQTPTETAAPSPLDVREVCTPASQLLEIEMTVGPTPRDMAAGMGQAFGTLMAVIRDNALTMAGPPRAIYAQGYGANTRFTAAIPIAEASGVLPTPDGVKVVSVPEQQALRFTHRGAYATLGETYRRIDAWLRDRGGIKTDADRTRYSPVWEEYVGDPTTTPEQELLTYVYFTLR